MHRCMNQPEAERGQMTELLIINGERVAGLRRRDVRGLRSVHRRACSRPSRRRRRRTSIARCETAHAALEVEGVGRHARRPSAAGSCSASRRRCAIGARSWRRSRAATTASRCGRRAPTCRWPRATSSSSPASPTRSWATRSRSARAFSTTRPRADRRVRADRAVELSDSDRRARRRAGARRRMRRRPEAVERSADDGAAARRDRARVRPAARRAQRRARHRHRRPASRSRAIRDINQLTFTGSVDVGIAVAKMAAENVVPVVMELGGKSPNIVFADADLDLTAQGVATAIFQNAGQTCSAGSRLLVERKAHDALVERLADAREEHAHRPGRERSRHGADHLEATARDDRALRADRRRPKARASPPAARGPTDPALGRGFYFQPTLLDRCRPTCASRRRRSSGRCSRSSTSTTSRRPPTIANRSQYGLVAGIWTRDINKAMTLAVAHQVRPGLHQHLRRRRRRRAAVRRLQEERLRAREGPGVAGQLHAGQECLRQVRRGVV